MRETIVFFRDDDVGELTDPLRFHFDLLLEHGISCHYLVVPDYLDRESAASFRRLKQAHPELIHLNQHGLHHEQEIDGSVVYSEFAGSRGYEEQLRDIGQGRDMLQQMLGDAFSADVFTPPCHKYDGDTLRVLGDLGFNTLSAGVRADWPSRLYYAAGRLLGRVDFLGKRVSYHRSITPDPRVAEVSVSIDVHEDQNAAGRRVNKGVEDLWAEFNVARRTLSAVGVMTHHQRCESPENQRVLQAFVARLAAEPGVRFADMLELVPARGVQ